MDGSSEIAPPVDAIKTLQRVDKAVSLVAVIEQLGDEAFSDTALAQFESPSEVRLEACSGDWQVSGLSISTRDGPAN